MIEQAGNVLLGRDDWLFLKNDSNDAVGQLTGNVTFNSTDILKWKLVLGCRKEYFKRNAIKYYYLVVPNKESAMVDFIEGVELSEDRPVMKFNELFKEIYSEDVCYPLQELTKHCTDFYPKGDSHWNHKGAFSSYQKLISNIQKDFPKVGVLSANDVNYVEQMQKGDLSGKLNGETLEANYIPRVKRSPPKMLFNNKCPNRGKKIIFTSAEKNQPTAVIFRDSFSSHLIPFLVHSFSRVVFVWQPNIDYSILEEEKPDIVISQQAERFLIRVPDDIHGETAQQTAKNKGF